MNIFQRKYKIVDSQLLENMTDIHSHILPGVDDGIRNMGDAIHTLDYFERKGVKRIIFTPHIMMGLLQNTPEYLRYKFQEFKNNYKGNIELRLAAEYMLDNDFQLHLHDNNLLTLNSNYLLIETSYANPPIYLNQLLEQINQKGFHIVLAHPERYSYMIYKDYSDLQKKYDISLQLNLLSLTGYYGSVIQKKAELLLNKDIYTFLGTDIHRLEVHRKEFEKKKVLNRAQIRKLEILKENNNQLMKRA